MVLLKSEIVFLEAMDPSEVKEYVSEFDVLLEDGETIDITFGVGFLVSVDPVATAFGISVAAAPAPIRIDADQNIQFFPEVASGNQADAAFNYGGVNALFTWTINTSLGRTYQKTFAIPIHQT